MTVLLRKIRMSRWFKDDPVLTWLGEDIPALPLSDLNATDHSISVFVVFQDRSNLDRVIAALAATTKLSNFDYMLFDEAIVSEVFIELVKTPGNTQDDLVNRDWHRDLVHMTAGRLVELARKLWENGERCRCHERDVKKLIEESKGTRHGP